MVLRPSQGSLFRGLWDDFGVKMGLELEIVDLAKTLKKQWFFNGFQCLEGV